MSDEPKHEQGWLIHKTGRGWYRPKAQGYTSDTAQAGRYSYDDAMSYSHPNGWDGPRDGITIKHESDLPDPAVPDDVAGLIAELRVIGCHENGDARCTCGIGMDAADALEAQAAELARYREALGPFAAVAEHDIGDDETDGEAFRPMQFVNRAPKLTVGDLRRARAALTQPTGDRT